MRVTVLGAGVVGATTAYYLAKRGHEVTVIDRQPDVGLETSFANGGLVSPSMSEPWAAPGIPLKLLTSLGHDDAPFLLRLRALPGMAGWGLRFLRNCTAKRFERNARTLRRLANYSRDALDSLTAETDIEYDRSTLGILMVYPDAAAFADAQRHMRSLGEMGVAYETLDARGCAALEPGLAPATDKLAGGIHLPNDQSGDAMKFTRETARLCRALGVEFRHGVTVTALEAAGDKVQSVVTDTGRMTADAYVVALATGSPAILRALGIKLSIYPVKGYSVTVPTAGWNNAPNVPVIDYGRLVAVTRLGDNIRVAGTVEFAGFDRSQNRGRGENLLDAARNLFPDFPATASAEHWSGLRPMTPDGPPVLGASPYRNLFLNTGHGSLGWTLACGSARVMADLLDGRAPEIDLDGMGLSRF